MYNPESRQFKVSLRCSETGKMSTVRINKDNFVSDEMALEYAREIQKENKAKNLAYRRSNQKKKLDTLVAKNIAEEPINNVVITDTVDINFDLNTGSTVAIFGASKRGKTTLMMHLYDKEYKDKPFITTLFSGNPHLKIYKNDPKLLIAYGFNKKSERYIKLEQYINTKTDNKYSFLNLFDDIVDQKYAPIMNKLVLTYRNSNISSIICLQYVLLLSKSNRSSINHTFVFGSNSTEDCENNVKYLLSSYFKDLGLRTLADQVAFYKKVTSDHGFIYIDNIKNKISFHRLPKPD